MSNVIVIAFVTLDGVTQDPDGAEGFQHGGWAFRFGPQAVAGDKFKLGHVLDTGALLLGRRTWQRFSQIWPSRTDDFSIKMNRIQKLVVSRSLDQVDAWGNSALLKGNLADEVRKRKTQQDVVVAGSDSVVQELMRHGLVDEYRILIFPIVLGEGRRLFRETISRMSLRLVNVEQSGEAALVTLSKLVPSNPSSS